MELSPAGAHPRAEIRLPSRYRCETGQVATQYLRGYPRSTATLAIRWYGSGNSLRATGH